MPFDPNKPFKRSDEAYPVERAPKVDYSAPAESLHALIRGISPIPVDREKLAYQQAMAPTTDELGRPVPSAGPMPSLNLDQTKPDPAAEAAAAQVAAQEQAYKKDYPMTAFGLEYGPSIVEGVRGAAGLAKAGARSLGKKLTGMTSEVAEAYAKDPKASKKITQAFKDPVGSELSVNTRKSLARGQEEISQQIIPELKSQRDSLLDSIPDSFYVETKDLGPKAQEWAKAYYGKPTTPKSMTQVRGPVGELIEVTEEAPRVIEMTAKDLYNMKDAVGSDTMTTGYVKGLIREYGDVGDAIDTLDDKIFDISRTRKTINTARRSSAPEKVYARDTQENIRIQKAAGLEEQAKQLQAGQKMDKPFELASPIETGAPKLGGLLLEASGPTRPGEKMDALRQLLTGAGLAASPEGQGYPVSKPAKSGFNPNKPFKKVE